MTLLPALEAFLDRHRLGPGDRLVIAFSGGGDSTALLWGLSRLAPDRGLALLAAHLDHGIDRGSAARAGRAAVLARQLRVPFVAARHPMAAWRRAGESIEAGARLARYRFLERIRRDARARHVATAHTLDDQAETVLLRLRFGSGLAGLAGIRPTAAGDTVVRPLLGLSRATLRQALAAAGLVPVEDPGNADPRQPRALVRHHLLPALAGSAAGDDPPARDLAALLARVADRAQRAAPALDRRLAAALGLPAIDLPAIDPPAIHLPALGLTAGGHPGGDPAARRRAERSGASAAKGPDDGDGADSAAADLARLAALPPALLQPALSLLHRRAGATWPSRRAAAAELARQLRRPLPAGLSESGAAGPPPPHAGCDCGDGWRWETRGGSLHLGRETAGERKTALAFTYTLEVPGTLFVPEAAVWIRVSRSAVAPWMLRGAANRVGLALPVPLPAAGLGLTVRNRRPGDRLQPLGSPGSRKLKQVLIDHGVPRRRRDQLPLLCWDGEIAWVPGITIGHRFRLDDGDRWAWLIEIEPLPVAAPEPGLQQDRAPAGIRAAGAGLR